MLKATHAALLAAAATLTLSACGGPQTAEAPAAETRRTVGVAQVELRPLIGGLTASGTMVAREEAAVGTELAGYRVTAVLADEGDYVRQGQILVRLDPALLRAQIAQLQANVAQQRVQAAQAQREAQRANGLDGEGVVATETIEQRRAAAAAARAGVAAAEAQLRELNTRLSRLAIGAPVAGRILSRNVRAGDIAAGGGEPMFRIARGGLFELVAELPEAELARVTTGQPVAVQLPSGETVTGQVRSVRPEVDQQSRLGAVRVSLPARNDLRPGGFARASFTAAVAPAPAVPEEALRFQAEGVSLMALDDQNRARRVPVRTGRRADGWVELVEGPPPGTRVLMGGGAFVLDGDVVDPAPARPVRAAQPTPPIRPAQGAAK